MITQASLSRNNQADRLTFGAHERVDRFDCVLDYVPKIRSLSSQLRFSFSQAGRIHQVLDQADQLRELLLDDLPGALTAFATDPELHQVKCRKHRRQRLTQLVCDGGKELILPAALIFDEPSGRTFPREGLISQLVGDAAFEDVGRASQESIHRRFLTRRRTVRLDPMGGHDREQVVGGENNGVDCTDRNPARVAARRTPGKSASSRMSKEEIRRRQTTARVQTL